jgi:hypothetical protein
VVILAGIPLLQSRNAATLWPRVPHIGIAVLIVHCLKIKWEQNMGVRETKNTTNGPKLMEI